MSRVTVTRFRMPSRRDAVARAVDRVLDLAAPARLSDDERDNLAVAVAEALSNAAVHGHGLRPDANVRVVVAVTPGASAEVEVADSGPGFDCEEVSIPRAGGAAQHAGPRRLPDAPAGRPPEYNEAGNKVRLTMERRPGR